MKLSTFRKATQIFFLVLFLLIFFFLAYPYPEKWPVKLLLQCEPLTALISMVAARAIISTMVAGLVVLLLTFVFGRFFCGYVCPLGTLIDLTGWFAVGKHGVKESREPKPGRRVKYLILAGVAAAALLGADLLHFFSPFAITPRFFTLVVFPPITWSLNAGFDLISPLMSKLGFDNLALTSWNRFYFDGALISLLFMAAILSAVYWRRRFWCRYVCPTGALLGLASRTSLLRRVSDANSCNDCGRCAMVCNMRAVETEYEKTVPGECTLCGNCVDACAKGSNRIALAGIGPVRDIYAGDARRSFVFSAVAGLAAASVLKGSSQGKFNLKGKLIRPPGSLPEPEFLARCVRCGACMKTCKTNGLQPCSLDAGLDGLWTPRLVSRIGGCEEKCNMCGHACPTQAIRALPLEEKRFVKLGTAVIDHSRCIAWEQDRQCLICDEICPYDAIEFRKVPNSGTLMNRPVVLASKCTGCGLCETKCPIAGQSAIEVYSIGEERKTHGSYITEEKKHMRAVKNADENVPQSGKEEDLPAGFQ